MNDFLTSVFPRAYAKIYNGMIQINGASFVSKYASNKEDMDPNKYIEKYATQRPSDQVCTKISTRQTKYMMHMI